VFGGFGGSVGSEWIMADDALVVTHNQAEHRFEIAVDGRTAFLEYHLGRDFVSLVHTEVPTEMEGRGIGGKLAKAGLEFARGANLKVIPSCPFVASYIRRHPEYLELVMEKYRKSVAQE
jgi:predicted GNAT family acetyltransferase